MYLFLFVIFAFSLQFETILAVPRPYSGHHLADSFCCRSARRLWSWRRRLFTIHHGETCLSERRAPQTDRTHSLTGQHCLVQATLHGGQRQGDSSAGASGTAGNSGFISTSGSGAALPCAGNPDGKASSSTLCFGDLGGSDLVLLGSSW